MAGGVPDFNIQLKGSWNALRILLDPGKIEGRINSNMRNATSHNAKLFAKGARQKIQDGVPPPNAALTVFIKGSTKPLAGLSGELFKALTHETLTPFKAEVGVKKGDKSANIAGVVHEGAKIRVTNRMRALFGFLADVSAKDKPVSSLKGRALELWSARPGGWKALRKSTTHIKIPSRPFLRMAIEDNKLRDRAGRNWSYAYAAAIAGKTWKQQR